MSLYEDKADTIWLQLIEEKEEECWAVGEERKVSKERLEEEDGANITGESAEYGGGSVVKDGESQKGDRTSSRTKSKRVCGKEVLNKKGDRWQEVREKRKRAEGSGRRKSLGKDVMEPEQRGGQCRLHAAESTMRAKHHRGDEESQTSVSIKDASDVEARRWEALGSDEENESEWEVLEYEEGSSEEGVQTDGRKYVRTKKEVTHHLHGMDRVVRVAFDVDDANVILRSRCMLGSLVKLNVTLDDFHKDAVRGTMFRAALEYGGMEMDQHLTLALVKYWGFYISRASCSIQFVSCGTNDWIAYTWMRARDLDRDEEVGEAANILVEAGVVGSEVCELYGKPRPGVQWGESGWHFLEALLVVGIERCAFSIIVICSQLVHIGVRRCTGDIRECVWAEAVWRDVMQTIEDTQRKLGSGPLSEIQLNGYGSMSIRHCLMCKTVNDIRGLLAGEKEITVADMMPNREAHVTGGYAFPDVGFSNEMVLHPWTTKEVARWRQKEKELDLRLQEGQSGSGARTGNPGCVPSKGASPITVEGHEMSHNVREEMDTQAERIAQSMKKADKKKRKAELLSPLPIRLTPDSGGRTTAVSSGAVAKVHVIREVMTNVVLYIVTARMHAQVVADDVDVERLFVVGGEPQPLLSQEELFRKTDVVPKWIWDVVLKGSNPPIHYVFISLLDLIIDHWLLFVGDLHEKKYHVHDPLPTVQQGKGARKYLPGKVVREGDVFAYGSQFEMWFML
ncbi:hypothetical protein Cgig2_017480 [Carnegiea gigantea]|uniref:Uncharacterized protein n=1 Tax=Carnegiea gigantea TaxID=171969 RepID=A0A9Q1JKW7_9CARY|nr:hypothetical protein Cgig2_017480 [Carnegiea gigantea]